MSSVVIVGAGVVGLCTALYCRRRGMEVTIVDRDGPGHLSCSFGNAGMVTPSHFVPLAAPGAVWQGLKWMWNPNAPLFVRPRASLDFARWLLAFWRSATAAHVERAAPLLRDLNLASRECYEALASEPGADFGFAQRGLLMVCSTEHGLEEEARMTAFAERLQVPTRVLSATAVRELEPLLREDIAGAVHYEADAHLSPDVFVRWLRERLTAEGARFVWNQEITDWNTGAGHARQLTGAITAGGEELAADEFVLCGGSWSPSLARKLGLDIPVEAGAGYSFTLEHPQAHLRYPAILVEGRVAVTPMGERLRVGGTMELSGLDAVVRHGRARAILAAMARYYEAPACTQFGDVKPWKGLRPCTPDGLPYIGRAPRVSNLVVATGHAMMGLSLAPITGKLVSQVLAGEATSLSLDLLAVDRFTAKRPVSAEVRHA